MLSNTLLSAALLAGAALAAPAADKVRDALEPRFTPLPPPTPFGLVAMADGQPFHNQRLSASESGLEIGKPNADAQCEGGKKQDHAAFILRDGWFLYNTTDVSTQQLWSDVSGMGQGVLQYTKNKEQADKLNRNRITTDKFGFMGAGTKERPSYLTWNIDHEFIACPSSKNEGAWYVWLKAGVQNPGGNEKCTAFRAQVVETPDALGCIYTTYSNNLV